ncbi:hypothetical protein B0H13DRAFT_1880537 [Mycena leptocephala]|nr:hypothetical protein B0H13DRAFT_1880537 [Mycena leptocephala]
MPRILSKENRAPPHVEQLTEKTVDQVSLVLKREALAEGGMTSALKVFLENAEFKPGTPFPSQKLIDAREKSRRARLQLKNAERHMSRKESELAINFNRGPSSAALRTTLNSRYIKAATRVRTLRKYVAYIDNQVEREEVERNNDEKIAEYLGAGGLVAEGSRQTLHMKIYLVTGRKVECPGAYASWTSADAQYRTVSAATVKGYKSWHALESAWFAGCDRGEHDHPPRPTLDGSAPSSPPSPPLPPSPLLPSSPPSSPACTPRPTFRSLSSPADSPSSCIRSPSSSTRSLSVASPSPPSPPARFPHTPPGMSLAGATPYSPTTGKVGPRTSHMVSGSPSGRDVIPGKMAYAVRSNGQGVVFGSYEQARGLYHQLQSQGRDASLAASPSLTDSVSFLEGFPVAGSSAEAARRRAWIHKEYDARHRRLIDTWRDTLGTDGGESDGWEDGVESDDDSWSSESSEVLTEVERYGYGSVRNFY